MQAIFDNILVGKYPSFEDLFEALERAMPLLTRLEHTPQDPIHHAEGHVLEHSRRVVADVLNQLEGEASHLSACKRLALILSALLHDVGKPLTTRVEQEGQLERIRSPRHADRGRSYLAYRLLELELPIPVLHDVLALVGHHHDPKKLVLNNARERAYLRLARLADPELLYHLELADVRGRECPDQAELLYHLELFRLLSEEAAIWQNTDPYRHWHEVIISKNKETADLEELILGRGLLDFEAGLISTPDEAIARAYGAREGFPQLIVTCGPSGSGKSTWLEKQRLAGWTIISLDALRKAITGQQGNQTENGRVLQAAKAELKSALRSKQRVVWDATNLRRDFRAVPLDLGHAYGALTTLAVFRLSIDELERRNRAREYAVSDAILAKQLEMLEYPYRFEAHRWLEIDAAGEIFFEDGGYFTQARGATQDA